MSKFFINMFIIFFLSKVAYASTAGLSLYGENVPYKGIGVVYTAYPIIKADSKSFYMNFPEGGFHLYSNDKFSINLKAEYTTLRLDKDKSSNRNIKKLGSKSADLYTGLQYLYYNSCGVIKVELLRDIVASEGLRGKLSYGELTIYTQNFNIYYELGILFYNKKRNNYFFGVTKDESIKSGFKEYDSKDSVSPFINAYATYTFNQGLSVIGSFSYSILPSAINKSPIIWANKSISASLGLAYVF